MATNFKAKSNRIGIKDRGALACGSFANWAFWYAKRGELLISSTMVSTSPNGLRNLSNQENDIHYINKG
jgi:hypothetical protein